MKISIAKHIAVIYPKKVYFHQTRYTRRAVVEFSFDR